MGDSVNEMNLTAEQWTNDLVAAFNSRNELAADEITIARFRELAACTEKAARRFLEKQIKDGKMTKKPVYLNDHIRYVYKRAK